MAVDEHDSAARAGSRKESMPTLLPSSAVGSVNVCLVMSLRVGKPSDRSGAEASSRSGLNVRGEPSFAASCVTRVHW